MRKLTDWMVDDAGSSEPLSELAILMTIIVNWLMPVRWLMERQTDGLYALSNIRQTYTVSTRRDCELHRF